MDATTPFLAGAIRWIAGDGGAAACDACGFRWSTEPPGALGLVAAAPARYRELLAGRDGMVPAADGGWNATGYVWHVADLAHGWAERWVALAESPGALLAGWDPDELADARNYRNKPTVSALWSLERDTAALVELTRSLGFDTPFEHGDWGPGTSGDAIVWIAHEFVHHQLDVAARAQ